MNVVIMVSSGYPHYWSANNTKGEFIARGLKANGCYVTMLDSIFGTKGFDEPEEGVSATGIDYYIIPRKGKWLSWFFAIPYIWNFLKSHRKKDDKNHIVLGLTQYPFFFIILIMAFLLGYRRSVLFHEWHCSLNKPMVSRMEGFIRDVTFGYFVNVVFPISHFLKEKSLHFHRRMMIVPVMASFENDYGKKEIRNHFAYCCGAPYLLRNTLVLDAFKLLKKQSHNDELKLELVLNGNDGQLNAVKNLVDNYGMKDSIIIRNQIPQEELTDIYESAIGLLIPMDPQSIQDKARFSQKIAEYVSTQRPIITSNVGEIPYYFDDNQSAMIVPYSVEGYFKGMKVLFDDKQIADYIGHRGYMVGKNCFNYIEITREMMNYL